MNLSKFRRPILPGIVLAATCVLELPFGLARAAEQPKKPNILFLFSDDQRADTIAAPQRPALGRLVCRSRGGIPTRPEGEQTVPVLRRLQRAARSAPGPEGIP